MHSKTFQKAESKLHYPALVITVLLGTEADDEDGEDENGHMRTPEAEQ